MINIFGLKNTRVDFNIILQDLKWIIKKRLSTVVECVNPNLQQLIITFVRNVKLCFASNIECQNNINVHKKYPVRLVK